ETCTVPSPGLPQPGPASPSIKDNVAISKRGFAKDRRRCRFILVFSSLLVRPAPCSDDRPVVAMEQKTGKGVTLWVDLRPGPPQMANVLEGPRREGQILQQELEADPAACSTLAVGGFTPPDGSPLSFHELD